MKDLRITRAQHEKDSEVFGAIMAGVKSRKKRLKTSLPGMETATAMCAVGAGNRGREVTRVSDVVKTSRSGDQSDDLLHQVIPLVRFAVINDVSEHYACGVNDGFEDGLGISRRFFEKVDIHCADYERGWHVGQAVRIESGL